MNMASWAGLSYMNNESRREKKEERKKKEMKKIGGANK